jgi:hypothetical protein
VKAILVARLRRWGGRGQRWNWSTSQCSNGEACGNARNRSCADIACDAANRREGAQGKGDVFRNLERYMLDMPFR